MGQAKLRGSKEQRCKEGEQKALKYTSAQEALKKARWDAMTPAERIKYVELCGLMARFENFGRMR